MSKNTIDYIFYHKETIERIKSKLPILFQLAELESSRAGKIGMEVGNVRERIIIALLLDVFGQTNVNADIPTTEKEVDVIVFGKPISIKTITSRNIGGFKLMWTVDPQKAKEFRDNYKPLADLLLIHINWGKDGGLYYITKETQKKILKNLGRNSYIKLPKPGTNPRGVEINGNAARFLVLDSETKSIKINWRKLGISFDPFEKWVRKWNE